MTLYRSPTSGILMVLQSTQTTGNGTAIPIPSSFRRHKFTIKGLATVSAGAVQLESADTVDYAGTWNPLGGGPITVVDISEIEYNFEGIYGALRARISTPIVGGTVTVTYLGGQ